MSVYTDFKAEWLGRRVDYDHVYGFQCVDLILQYIYEKFGTPSGVYGNAIDYWNNPSPALLVHFDKVAGSQANQGDIVVFNGLPGNPYGHIGICDSEDGSNVTILEQNGSGVNSGSGTGGNAIRLRAIPRSRVAGVLRPKSTPAPAQGSAGTAHVQREAYVRAAPNTAAALAGSRLLEPGDTFQYSGKVTGQAVGGNNVWYQSVYGHYVWSGNVSG